jgi:hypothetical protein
VAGGLVLVVRSGLARRLGQGASLGEQPGVVGCERAAAAPGDDLVAVEGEGGEERAAAGMAPVAVLRAERAGAVAHQRHAPAVAERPDRQEVAALAKEVHRHHGAREAAGAAGAGELALQQIRVEGPASGLDIQEARRGAHLHGGRDSGDEG